MLFDQKDSLPAFDLSQRDSRDFTAAVCFSSGTSGKAKGVEISHYNFIATLLSARASTPPLYSGDIRGVFFAPLCHIYGQYITPSKSVVPNSDMTSRLGNCRSFERLHWLLHHGTEEIHA
jgi:long-subunit acyl-CoA synthetase (AMP-forming)